MGPPPSFGQPGPSAYPPYNPVPPPPYQNGNVGLGYPSHPPVHPLPPPSLSPMNGVAGGAFSSHHNRGGPPYSPYSPPPPPPRHDNSHYYPQSQFIPPPSPYGAPTHLHPHPKHAGALPHDPHPSYSPAYVHPSTSFSPTYSSQHLSPLTPQMPIPPSTVNNMSAVSSIPPNSNPAPTSLPDTFFKPAQSSLDEEELPKETTPLILALLSSPSSTTKRLPGSSSLGSLSTTPSTASPTWAIWSRRPRDPSQAPAIIISPRARPPSNVCQGALNLPSPPPSPEVPSVPAHLADGTGSRPVEAHSSPSSAVETLATVSTTTPAPSTAPDTPVPGSPNSSSTSISSPMIGKGTTAQPESASSLHPSVVLPADILVGEGASPDNVAPSPPVAPTPPPRKSWASILRSTEPTEAGSSRSALPKSSVVGFSIPASSLASDTHQTALAIPLKQRNELLALLTSTNPALGWGAPKIVPRGLVNQGNMCFANSVLQILVYCPPFHRFFSDIGRVLRSEKPTGPAARGQDRGTPLVDATITFLREFIDGKWREHEENDMVDSFLPSYVYDAMKEKTRFDSMRGGHQEDAEEFLGFYLDTLEEELLSLTSALDPSASKSNAIQSPLLEKEEPEPTEGDGWTEVGRRNKLVVTRMIRTADSPISRIFGGKFRSALRAPGQRESVTIEDWRSLQLDIQKEQVRTIQDAIQSIAHPQSVQLSTPSRPDVQVEGSQQVLIDALPPILVLHLKRFQYDTEAKGVVKIGKQISYGPILEIPQDIIAPARRSTRLIEYKLFSVLYHHGLSATGGHYTLDVLHPNRDLTNGKPREAWIRIDDEFVSDVRDQDVFGISDREDRCAYLLFYRRVGPSTMKS